MRSPPQRPAFPDPSYLSAPVMMSRLVRLFACVLGALLRLTCPDSPETPGGSAASVCPHEPGTAFAPLRCHPVTLKQAVSTLLSTSVSPQRTHACPAAVHLLQERTDLGLCSFVQCRQMCRIRHLKKPGHDCKKRISKHRGHHG